MDKDVKGAKGDAGQRGEGVSQHKRMAMGVMPASGTGKKPGK